MRKLVIVLSLIFFNSGCTTVLTHERLIVGNQPLEPGFSYYLPRQQFTVTATYELRECPNAAGDAAAASRPLIISQSTSIAETPVADPAELYSIPIKTMTSLWKTTTLVGTVYDNQTLHTFGATVDDRSGEIIKSTVNTAITVAKMVIGVPAATNAPQLCRPEIYKALDTLRAGKTKLLDPTLDEKTRAGWVAAMVSARTILQIIEVYVFDPTISNLEQTFTPAPDKLVSWFANAALISTANSNDRDAYDRTLKTVMHIRDKPTDLVALPKALIGQGVIYKEPAPIVLLVCAGLCTGAKPKVLATLMTQAAQFGRYAVIPLENGTFQKNNLALTFASNGRLESFTYGNESRLEKIATAISGTATSVESFLAKKKTADEAAATAAAGAELKTLKSETELLKAKADKIEAEARLLNLGGVR
ncbi:hypothetical protein SAMN05216308_11712 [Nitrosospira sp. Nsp13]|nr:hypothetical protein SAMN05216308_11712 [Nitrosospira sp. Nsp13]